MRTSPLRTSRDTLLKLLNMFPSDGLNLKRKGLGCVIVKMLLFNEAITLARDFTGHQV